MYNLLTLLIMNHGCNLIVSPFNIFHASLRNLGMGAWARTLKLCKVFTKVGWGPWLKRKLCLGPASVITALHYPHCPSEWVCFLERLAITFGALAGKLFTLRRQSCLGLLWGLVAQIFTLLERFRSSMPRTSMLVDIGWQQVGGFHPAGWRRGPDQPPGRE